MATPMTPSQIKAQLKKWGLRYEEYKDWDKHNRNHKGPWGPVNGFMVHHTGSDSKDQRALLYNGLSGLPGPLCHFGLAQDGTVHLIGWGRANHAGAGDPDVLDAVIDERPAPVDNESSVDFNARFYGVEIWYSGSHEMTDAQYESLLKLSACVLDFHGWNQYSVIGHGESGSPGKWDPGYAPGKMMDMDDVRDDIRATLKDEDKPKNPQKPATPKPVGDTYTVLAGDTLSGIGKKLKVNWEDLAKLNKLKAPYVIHPGDKLKVPGKSGKPAPKPKPPAFPGRNYFRPGAVNKHVELLGKQLVKKGYGRHYRSGPGPRWTEADRRNVQAFQWAQGWRGSDADGYPGPLTWVRLFG